MPRVAGVPRLTHHKASGRALVRVSGKDFYLGPWGTQLARNEYDRIIGEWLASGRNLAVLVPSTDLTIAEVLEAYFKHIDSYYPDQTRGEPVVIREALKPLRRLYGKTNTTSFGPLALKAVMDEMLQLNWSRPYINRQAGRIKRMFKWAVAQELIPASVFHGLQAVSGLRAGHTTARETTPVKPVPIEHVDATIAQCGRHVGAMIRLQLLTGARPGEICAMRTCEIDTTGNLWVYRPAHHKTLHHGHQRTIVLGPRAQEVLKPFLRPDLQAFIFQPLEAEAERRAIMHANRKTPLKYGNRPGTNVKKNPKFKPGDRYDTAAYRRAIDRAADKAGVPHWHPHQLRDTAATELRKQFGIEAARVVLGHRSSAVTEIYAELDTAKASEIMAQVG